MPPSSKGIRITAILSLIAIACVIGVYLRISLDDRKGDRASASKLQTTEYRVQPAVESNPTAKSSESRNSAEAIPKVASQLPDFEHDFIQIDQVFDERFELKGDNRIRRSRLARTPQYAEEVVVVEDFRRASDGKWERIETHFEIAAEWMVKAHPETSGIIQELISSHGAEVIDHIAPLGMWTLRFKGVEFDERDILRSELEELNGVESVVPNELIWPAWIPDDPGYSSQWEFGWIEAEKAWDLAKTASINDRQRVVAAIVDTGVNVEHADLSPWVNPGEIAANNLDDDGNGHVDDVNGFDFYTRTGNVRRTSGHGVGVAFTAGRVTNNGLQKASAGGQVDIMACVCFSTSGAGSTSAANNSIIYAVDNGARVINCSFIGGSAYTYMYAINYAESHGVIVVAGSGNNGKDIDVSPVYPVASAQSNVVGVGATGASDAIESYSNYGSKAVEIFAPAPSHGTSYATPVITAAVSLLIADDPNAPATTIIDRLVKGADKKADLAGKAVSEGRVNLLKSLRLNTLRRPDQLRAYPLNGGGVRLFWNDCSTAELGFVVERSSTDPATVQNPDDPAQMSWDQVSDQIPADTTFFDDLSAMADEVWFYRVRAKGSAFDSGRNFVTRVQASEEPASAVEALDEPVAELFSQGSAEGVRLAWFDRSGNESGFVLERREAESDGFYELARLAAGATTYADSDVDAGVTYAYRLKTYNAAFGSYSDEVVETAAAEAEPIVLGTPANLMVTPESFSAVHLTWADEATGEFGYHVWRASTPEGAFVLVATLPPDSTEYVDTELLSESTYIYRVEAFSAFGSMSSSARETTTLAEPAILAEALLSGIALDAERIELSWMDAASERQTAYKVERATGDGPFEPVQEVEADLHSFLDPGRLPATIYNYRVGTTDGLEVVYSNEISVETPPPPPILIRPTLDFEVTGATVARISWEDASIRESGYVIERAPSAEGPFAELAVVPEDSTGYTDGLLAPGQKAYYRIRVQGYDQGRLVELVSDVVGLKSLTAEEQWRDDYFGSRGDVGSAARTADPDGDGWTNLAEFATLHSPLSAQPDLALPGMTPDGRVTLQFDRRLNPTVSYLVQVTSDLNQAWKNLAEFPSGANGWMAYESGVEVEEFPRGADGASVFVIDSSSHAGEMRFLRLVIEVSD